LMWLTVLMYVGLARVLPSQRVIKLGNKEYYHYGCIYFTAQEPKRGYIRGWGKHGGGIIAWVIYKRKIVSRYFSG
uniref:hypothetical protein n=1 Tax=Shewanella sp. TaxID=50422 RepID=UPI004047B27D